MIFYFSGTGNSRWVAAQLADHFSDTLYPIGEYGRNENPLAPEFEVKPGEKIGFVFPIHSWGMPPIVTQFIANMQLKGYSNQQVYCIMTCGDECGHSDRMFAEAIKAKGLETKHVYSLVMPNSYICLKGFDVDSKEVQVQKMEQVKLDLPRLIAAIENDQLLDFYAKGKRFLKIKSGLIYNLFVKYSLTDKPYTCDNKCISCGKCVKACPVNNIVLANGKPTWKGHCTQCLACIHICPTKSIDYGKGTRNKGRYFFQENRP
ncbi:MAG TPA: EFR1 family ferrodoxin [Prolixibacteraceae bacterium]|nr:EFR1 family ferrodoxin [Prolixibacteraceae bacterium]